MILRALEALARRLPSPEEINGGKRCPTYLFRWELLSILGGSNGRWVFWRDYVAKGSPHARTTCEGV